MKNRKNNPESLFPKISSICTCHETRHLWKCHPNPISGSWDILFTEKKQTHNTEKNTFAFAEVAVICENIFKINICLFLFVCIILIIHTQGYIISRYFHQSFYFYYHAIRSPISLTGILAYYIKYASIHFTMQTFSSHRFLCSRYPWGSPIWTFYNINQFLAYEGEKRMKVNLSWTWSIFNQAFVGGSVASIHSFSYWIASMLGHHLERL